MVTGRKLLLADDSATIQKVVDLTFKDEGLEVITVSDGQQAIEKLEEVVPDIVLADVFMPGLNGYEVCEHIKRSERFRHIPVMLLVGSFEPFDEAEARRVGADDYLTKPFQSIRTLIGKVGNLLSGGGPAAEEATTRRLAPPPEAEKENRPDTEFLERSTADTAPLHPDERAEMMERAGNSREVSFADLSMDDQMIEAKPAEGYSAGGGVGVGVGGGSSSSHPLPETHGARPTAAYSAADLNEAGITEAVERAPEPDVEAPVNAYNAARASEGSSHAAPSQQSTRAMSAQPSSDDSLLDLGELEPPRAQAEADDFFLDLFDDSPRAAQAAASAPSYAGTPERTGGVAVAAPASAASSSSSSPAAEEMDAAARTDYEEETAQTAPPETGGFTTAQSMGEASREETGEAQVPVKADESPAAVMAEPAAESAPPAREQFFTETQSAPTERLPDAFRMEEATAAPSDAQSQEPLSGAHGQITLAQMSPEVIDAIARRVVEQMSARVVEQVAWEVVPELAERLIQRRLDEEKS